MWRKLQQEVPHVFFNARWIKRAEKEDAMEGDDFRELWHECQQDVKDADVILVYAEDDERLKGALVEIGMAIAFGVRVIIVTTVEDPITLLGTWLWNNGVMRVRTMEEAMKQLYLMTDKGRREEREALWWSVSSEREKVQGDAVKPEGCCGGTGEDCHCK